MNPSAESQTTPKVEQTGKQQTQAGNYFVFKLLPLLILEAVVCRSIPASSGTFPASGYPPGL